MSKNLRLAFIKTVTKTLGFRTPKQVKKVKKVKKGFTSHVKRKTFLLERLTNK